MRMFESLFRFAKLFSPSESLPSMFNLALCLTVKCFFYGCILQSVHCMICRTRRWATGLPTVKPDTDVGQRRCQGKKGKNPNEVNYLGKQSSLFCTAHILTTFFCDNV